MVDRTPVGDNGDGRDLGDRWRKSSYSMSNGHCVEAARLAGGSIGVRDSRAVARGGPVLRFEPGAWTTFLAELRISASPES
jgi:Domain of unknown function (DUF397)